MLEATWDNAEHQLHRVWGFAKLRGYSREEKHAFGALGSMLTRLRDQHDATIRRMANTPNQLETDEPLLKYFRTDHLTNEGLREASQPFAELAQRIVLRYPRNPERTVALRKLLEGKDAAVRCALESLGATPPRTV